MIRRLHADRDICDRIVDLLFRARQGLVGVHDGAVTFVRGKVAIAVVGDESAETLPEIQKPVFRPQVHQPVAAGGPGQAHDTAHARSHFQKGTEAFSLVAFEARELINDYHVVVKGKITLLHQPLHIFPIDDVYRHILHQCCFPLQLIADRHRIGQAVQMVPFLNFGGPGVAGDAERGDDQYLPDEKAVKAKVKDGG